MCLAEVGDEELSAAVAFPRLSFFLNRCPRQPVASRQPRESCTALSSVLRAESVKARGLRFEVEGSSTGFRHKA